MERSRLTLTVNPSKDNSGYPIALRAPEFIACPLEAVRTESKSCRMINWLSAVSYKAYTINNADVYMSYIDLIYNIMLESAELRF